VSPAPIADADEARRIDELLRRWGEPWRESGVLAALESTGEPDERGQYRWLVRLAGEEKEFITLWLTLRQRTVHVEAQLMPAPEERVEEVYRYLLAKNADLFDLHLALGPEAAIYLVGRVPAGELDAEALDELCGAALQHVEEIFPTAMAMGLGSLYRRRRARGGSAPAR
jgi:hypothetical protein